MAPHIEVDMASSNGNGFGNSEYGSSLSSRKESVTVQSSNVVYTENEILSRYTYRTTSVVKDDTGKYLATPQDTQYDFKIDRKVPRVGVMLVGWGGNNGTTITAGIIANRSNLSWETREGLRTANYYGSVVMGSTITLGTDAKTHRDVNIPFHDILPMVHPNDLVVGGWDISSMNLAEAMDRAAVLEPTLKAQVKKEMAQIIPLPSLYYPDFIASNQSDRADNLVYGSCACIEHVEHIRQDIR